MMPPQITSSSYLAQQHGVKGVVYGDAGVGKTTLASTLDNPLLVSAESGMLSLQTFNIATWPITKFCEIVDVYNFLRSSQEAQHFSSVIIDSASEVGDIVLKDCLAKNKDGRAAYGIMQDMVKAILKDFRDLKGKDVWIIFRMFSMEVNPGQRKFMPEMPGQRLSPLVPYLFDEVFYMATKPPGPDGRSERYLQTQPDFNHVAKDRSSRLLPQEQANLGLITRKIKGTL
jgi:hypothetical protein